MAEAMELDLTLNEPNGRQIKNPILSIKDAPNENLLVPEHYTTEAYYENDKLGSDVLKQKYLAPWEKHPYQMWKRQANALASVEKNKKLRKEWESKFFNILEDLSLSPAEELCTVPVEKISLLR